MSGKQPIGVFDSGVGGLTVLHKLIEILPDEDLIYLGDTARLPYGNKSPQTIQFYAEQCAQFLLEKNVKLIVVACNTMSAVALDIVEAVSHVPVIGVINPGAKAAVAMTKHGKIGVIGTYATVKSQAYDLAITDFAPNKELKIFSQACPLFVPFAEEGWHQHEAAYIVAKEYLSALQAHDVDTLILGCTHYPLLKTVIHSIMPEVALIDSGEEAALIAKQILIKNAALNYPMNIARKIDGYLTDVNPRFSQIATQFLGIPFNSLEHVNLDKAQTRTSSTIFPSTSLFDNDLGKTISGNKKP